MDQRQPRNKRLMIRLTQDEKVQLASMAKAAGARNVSDFVRGRMLEPEAAADELARLRADLAVEREARAAADRRAMKVLTLEREVERLRKKLAADR